MEDFNGVGGRASLHHGIFAGAGPFGGPFGLLLLDGQVGEQGRVLRLQLSHGTFEVELGRGVEWLLGQSAGRRGQRGRWGQGHAPVVLLGGDVVGCVLPLAAGSALRGRRL